MRNDDGHSQQFQGFVSDCGILTVLQVTVMTLVMVQAMALPSCPLVSVNLVTTPSTQL